MGQVFEAELSVVEVRASLLAMPAQSEEAAPLVPETRVLKGELKRFPLAPAVVGAGRVDPDAEAILQAETAWGTPFEIFIEQPLLSWELDLIDRVCGDHRHHDVTVFVRKDTALAMVRKPSDPPGVWWVPAGGVGPGESLGDAGRREAWEEAGVRCRVERYLVRVNAQFNCGDRHRPWTSHVFEAVWESGDPHPIDTKEVEAARWLPSLDFAREIVPLMRASGWGRFDYRLRMAAAVFGELGLPGSIELPPPLQCSGR